MEARKYSVVYSSKTGNTKKLAEAIVEGLPKEACEYFGEAKTTELTSDTIFLGFWTDKGTADSETLTILKNLKGKQIFLFGTAGFGGSESYFQRILNTVRESVDSSNTIIGSFMCQGKMPPSVKERYEKMKLLPNPIPNIDELIANFDKAVSHPDNTDLENLKTAVTKAYER